MSTEETSGRMRNRLGIFPPPFLPLKANPMRRSLFIALGVMAIILGFECLIIDSAHIYAAADTQASSFVNPSGSPSMSTKEWRPSEWMPWVMLAGGTITVLYAFTLPTRFRGQVAI